MTEPDERPVPGGSHVTAARPANACTGTWIVDDVLNRCTAQELVDRALRLAPCLRERIAETERLRQLPDETVRDAAESGIFALLLPKSLGGAGGGLREYIEVVRALATADPSAAWVLSFYITHNWFLARWPEKAQRDFFAVHCPALMAGVANPPGVAERTPGGYLVSGSWGYCSGVVHADWVGVAAVLDGESEPSQFVLPRAQVHVRDTWHMNGMKGTGSHSVELQSAFVPEHLRLASSDWIARGNPGAALHPEPLYSYDLRDVTVFMIPTIILGAAEALLGLYRERLHHRREVFSQTLTGDTSTGQLRYARAVAALRAARAVLDRSVDLTVETNARQAESMSHEIRAHIKLDCLTVARLSWESVELGLAGSGSSFYQSSDVTQHFIRDMQVAMSHLTLDPDVMGTRAGAILLERTEEPNPSDIFL
jgi:alkylation response protein AidB-like acyl-CoA dehydrogenase